MCSMMNEVKSEKERKKRTTISSRKLKWNIHTWKYDGSDPGCSLILANMYALRSSLFFCKGL